MYEEILKQEDRTVSATGGGVHFDEKDWKRWRSSTDICPPMHTVWTGLGPGHDKSGMAKDVVKGGLLLGSRPEGVRAKFGYADFEMGPYGGKFYFRRLFRRPAEMVYEVGDYRICCDGDLGKRKQLLVFFRGNKVVAAAVYEGEQDLVDINSASICWSRYEWEPDAKLDVPSELIFDPFAVPRQSGQCCKF
jgi:hypothetical protein